MKIKFLLILSGLLLIGFAFISLPLFTHLKNEVQKEVKLKIFNNKFKISELIPFSERELEEAKWLHPKEFILNDQLYDVVQVQQLGGKKIYFTFHDRKETKLAKIEKNIQQLNFLTHTEQNYRRPRNFDPHKFKNMGIEMANNGQLCGDHNSAYTGISNYKIQLKVSDFIEKDIQPPRF